VNVHAPRPVIGPAGYISTGAKKCNSSLRLNFLAAPLVYRRSIPVKDKSKLQQTLPVGTR